MLRRRSLILGLWSIWGLLRRWLILHRRMIGLFTLFYAILHMLAYFIFILGFNFSSFGSELIKRPYILLTIPAVILLVILGATSTKNMMRKLGKNWVNLHKSIYLIAILAWLHVLLQVRSSYADPILFGVLTALLLGIRIFWFFNKKRKVL
ncbi:MAG: hypothetical protein EOP48_13625 [Sphingobacteriales bacterium]|nr:MAG: hypothetical protein EOP48_13625 [Sphingobacteriales bacterium]